MRTLIARSAGALFLAALAPAVRAQSTTLFLEDFESGISNWTTETLWHLHDGSTTCTALPSPFPSGTHCAWFGAPQWCAIADPNGWQWFDGFLTQNAPVALPADGRTLRLAFGTASAGEDDGIWDRRSVDALIDETGNWVRVGELFSMGWHTDTIDLTQYAGHTVRLRFEYWTGDQWVNDYFGWFIDDVRIEAVDELVTPFCTGEGGDGHCPCSNVGGAGRGCPSSINPLGALLSATGAPSFTNETLSILASDVSPAPVTFFAGALRTPDGWNAIFGDGRRCVVGTVVRYRASPDQNGVAQIPIAGGPTLGQKFNVTPTSPTRYVQALYRNSAPFCTNATYNLTNGLIVTWRP
jgi:hypothetical protein